MWRERKPCLLLRPGLLHVFRCIFVLGSGVRLLFHSCLWRGFFLFCFLDVKRGKRSCAEVSFFCFVHFLCFRNLENCFGYFWKYSLCRRLFDQQQRPRIGSLLHSLQSFWNGGDKHWSGAPVRVGRRRARPRAARHGRVLTTPSHTQTPPPPPHVFQRLNSPIFSISSIQQPANNAVSLGPENS